MADVAIARVGGVLALFLTGTNFSVSSGIGFLALFGVSIQTGILLVSYMNQLRRNGATVRDAVVALAKYYHRSPEINRGQTTFNL